MYKLFNEWDFPEGALEDEAVRRAILVAFFRNYYEKKTGNKFSPDIPKEECKIIVNQEHDTRPELPLIGMYHNETPVVRLCKSQHDGRYQIYVLELDESKNGADY